MPRVIRQTLSNLSGAQLDNKVIFVSTMILHALLDVGIFKRSEIFWFVSVLPLGSRSESYEDPTCPDKSNCARIVHEDSNCVM